MDELLPKATGFDAKIEKRRAKIEIRKEREISPGLNGLCLFVIIMCMLFYLQILMILHYWVVEQGKYIYTV